MNQSDGKPTLDAHARSQLLNHHPLITTKVLLPTKPIQEVYLEIRRVVLLREISCYATGKSGLGKSSALAVIAAMLVRELPGLFVISYSTRNQQVPSIRAFFKYFLKMVGHQNRKGETEDLRDRLISCLIHHSRQSSFGIAVLLLDEAQAMSLQDFLFLKDVYNDLALEGVQLVTVLMGQEPDFSNVIHQLQHESRLDLTGRFAMRKIPFRGFSTEDDLRDILWHIDNEIFPENTECSWTEFFFPEAYREGFRMVDQAKNFYVSLRSAYESGNAALEYPARQTFAAIRNFMTENATFQSDQIKDPSKRWAAAVEYARMALALHMMDAAKDGDMINIQR